MILGCPKVSFDFPVTFDQDSLSQYREELEWTNQEVEMLAITLERHPEDMATVEQIRNILQESWMSSVKLDLTPVSESLADTIKGLDLLLDWQVYPPAMTEFILILIDRLMIIAHEVEEKQIIDMRKTQAILVALQYIILAESFEQIDQGVSNAITAISQPIADNSSQASNSDDVMLFDDGVDLFDDGVDLFDDTPAEPALLCVPEDSEPAADIFIPDVTLNPLFQARDFIQGHSDDNCAILLGQIADAASEHHSTHARFLLELALSMNILAGKPLVFESIYKGICMHDIALASMPEAVIKKDQLSKDDIDQLRQHPLKSAEMAHEFIHSDESELLVLHHHERLDGSGYPFGLIGNNICEYGKLAAIVDTFHDIINRHKQLNEKQRVLRGIVEINLGTGRQFDPGWVNLFNICMRDYWLPDWREARWAKHKKTA